MSFLYQYDILAIKVHPLTQISIQRSKTVSTKMISKSVSESAILLKANKSNDNPSSVPNQFSDRQLNLTFPIAMKWVLALLLVFLVVSAQEKDNDIDLSFGNCPIEGACPSSQCCTDYSCDNERLGNGKSVKCCSKEELLNEQQMSQESRICSPCLKCGKLQSQLLFGYAPEYFQKHAEYG